MPEVKEPLKMSISDAFNNEDELGVSMEVINIVEEDCCDKHVDVAEYPKMVPQTPIEPFAATPVIEKTLSPAELYKVHAKDES